MLLVTQKMLKSTNIFVLELPVQDFIFLNESCDFGVVWRMILLIAQNRKIHWLEVFFYVSDSEYAEVVWIYYMYATTATLYFSCWFFEKLDGCCQM